MAMQIAVLGCGRMGSAVAQLCSLAGHRVVTSNTRIPRTMDPMAIQFGPGICVMSSENAIRASEIVVLAVPWAARTDICKNAEVFSGRIVLDLMNAYSSYPHVLDLAGATSSEIVALELPSANIVKTLNTLQARSVLTRARPRGSPERIAVPICGDNVASKQVITELVDQIGFDSVDIGALKYGHWSEPDRPLFGIERNAAELSEFFLKCVVLEKQTC